MTIKEAVINELIPYTVPDGLIEKAMIDVGIVDGTLSYTAAEKQPVYRAAFSALRSMLVLKDIGEGDFKVAYDKEGLLAKMRAIAAIAGDQDMIDEVAIPVPTVTAPKVW